METSSASLPVVEETVHVPIITNHYTLRRDDAVAEAVIDFLEKRDAERNETERLLEKRFLEDGVEKHQKFIEVPQIEYITSDVVIVEVGKGDSLMVDAWTHGACSIIMLLLIVLAWALPTYHPTMDAIEASEFESGDIWLKTYEQGPSLNWTEGCENLEEGAIQRLWLSKTHIGHSPAEHWQVYAQVQVAEGGENKVVMTDVNHWGSAMWGSPIYARCKVLESDLAPNFLAEATEYRPTLSGRFLSPLSRARWTIEVQGPFHPMAMQRLAMDFVSRCNTYFLSSVNCQAYAKSIISAATKEKDIQAANVRLWTPFWQESAVMAIGCFLLGISTHYAVTNKAWDVKEVTETPFENSAYYTAVIVWKSGGTVAYFAAMSRYLIGSLVLVYFYPNPIVAFCLAPVPALLPYLQNESNTVLSPASVLLSFWLFLLPFLALWPMGVLELQTGFLSDLFGKMAYIPYCLSSATWKWIVASITGFMLHAIVWGSWRRYQQGRLLKYYHSLVEQSFISDATARERVARYSAENGTHVSVFVAAFIAFSSSMTVGGVCFLIVGDLREAGYFLTEKALEGCTYRDTSLKHATQIEQMVLLLVVVLLCLISKCCLCMSAHMKACFNSMQGSFYAILENLLPKVVTDRMAYLSP